MEREIQPGSRIGPLLFERELGRGAFATVWLAKDTILDRPVAVKELRTGVAGASEADRERFLSEARLIGRLKSPHVVTLHAVHPLPAGDGWLLEMEFAEEGTLQDALDAGAPLTEERVRAIVRGVASALDVAHAQGVIHGDVKPANVLLGRRGEVKLSDFGLATLLGDASLALSLRGRAIGTPCYMAPEVVMGERLTPLSDIWSFGVLLFRLVSGRLPFEGRTMDSLFFQIHHAAPRLPAERMPESLARLALRCLAKPPDARPASAEELLRALDEPAPRPAVGAAPARETPQVQNLVGRDDERRRIDGLLDTAAKGRGAALVLTGEMGVGKSALLRCAAEGARRRGFHVIEAATAPLRGVVRPLLGALRETFSAAALGEEGLRLLTEGDTGSASSAVRRALMESDDARLPDRQEAAWIVERILAGLAARRPVALLVDDAQHAGKQDAAFLTEIAAHLRDAAVLVAVACRTPVEGGEKDGGEVPLHDLLAIPGAERLDVTPLAREDLYTLLHAAAMSARLSAEVAGRVLDVAGGNPLLGVELLRHLVATSAAVAKDGVLVPGAAWPHADLPGRFYEIVSLRVGRLDEDERAVLDVAAVDGPTFDGEAVAAALEVPLLVALRRLQALTRRGGLLAPQPTGYRFAHPVVHEVVYRELAPDLRRALHRRLAEHLLARGSGVDDERIGLHWERAGEARRGAPHLLRAALGASRRQEYLHALDLAARAGLLPDGITDDAARDQAELLFALCGCLSDRAQPQEAETILEKMLAAAGRLGDSVLTTRVAVWREDLRFHARGGDAVDTEVLQRACETLKESEELGRAHYLLGSVAKFRDQPEEAADQLRRAQAIFASVGPRRMVATTTNQRASVALRAGRLAEAEALYAEAVALSRNAGRRTNAAISEVNRVVAALARGTAGPLVDPLRRAIRELEIAGAANHVAAATVNLSQVLYGAGATAAAEGAVAEALAGVERASFVPGIALARLQRSRLHALRGRLDAALADLAVARDAARSSGDRKEQLEVLVQAVRCATFAADPKSALEAARELAASAREASSQAAAGAVLATAESVLLGLPCEALEAFDEVTAALVPSESPPSVIAPVVVAAARELSAGSGSAALRDAARAYRAHPCGERRAESLATADWLDAEAARRDGDAAAAERHGEDAREQAERLGHVWLLAAILRTLARNDPDGAHRAHLSSVLELAARGIASFDERTRVIAAWDKS